MEIFAMKTLALSLALVLGFGIQVGNGAEVTVKLSDMHICCGGCTNAIVKATKDVAGAKVVVDQDSEAVTITAESKEAAQKAVDAIIGAGYHAKTDSKEVTITDDSGAKAGNVKRLTVTGAHNCCGACTVAIKGALKGVSGVQADTCKAKQTEFVVEGDFDGQAVVKALNDVGFHVKVK
jgi:periplasmic mercuric ion binding protein